MELETAYDLQINAQPSAEVFQIVTEGLNHLRKYGESAHALVEFRKKDDHLILQIENEDTGPLPPVPFTLGSQRV